MSSRRMLMSTLEVEHDLIYVGIIDPHAARPRWPWSRRTGPTSGSWGSRRRRCYDDDGDHQRIDRHPGGALEPEGDFDLRPARHHVGFAGRRLMEGLHADTQRAPVQALSFRPYSPARRLGRRGLSSMRHH